MIRRPIKPRRQKGIVIPMTAVAMIALVGMAGLILDFGHTYINKTRLQNAVDAAALSAAKTLDQTKSTTAATLAANAAFDLVKGGPGNVELADLTPLITFSNSVDPFTAGGNTFVRAQATGTTQLSFVRGLELLGFPSMGDLQVAVSAVAGPRSLNTVCNSVPIAMCKYSDPPLGTRFPVRWGQDKTLHYAFSFDEHACDDDSCRDLAKLLAGSSNKCLAPGDPFPEEIREVGSSGSGSGSSSGSGSADQIKRAIGQGINTRFACDSLPGQYVACDNSVTGNLSPDLVPDAGPSGWPDNFDAYKTAYDPANHGSWRADGVPNRRLISVPLLAPTSEFCLNGEGGATIIGFECFLLEEPVAQNGTTCGGSGQPGDLCVRRLTPLGCPGYGTPSGVPGLKPGPRDIVLYNDVDTHSPDS